mmetsp:Transcript_31835/g.69634  ORF Transcript_31835/g.69634 Transcript_31835/m.69634 type:complete len:296 (-) Transcript_31835:228-1115(-)
MVTRRCWEPLARSSSLVSSSTAKPVAAFFFCSMKRKTELTCSVAVATACSACSMTSFVRSLPVWSMLLASSARSTSSSAGVSFSMTSAEAFRAACRWRKSWRTVLRGFSFVCASCSKFCSLLRSVFALARPPSLSKRRVLACLALRKMRASPMAFCASCTACSVCETADFTSSVSSPAAVIISAVMTAFSTQSSAKFVFCSASGMISCRAARSFTSTSFILAECSAFARAFRIFVNSLFTPVCIARIWEPICAICLAPSPETPRCASINFFSASFSVETCGANTGSAALSDSGLL